MRTVYLHVLPFEGERWSSYLGFRDSLRTNPELRAEYNDLKRALASALPPRSRPLHEGESRLHRQGVEGADLLIVG